MYKKVWYEVVVLLFFLTFSLLSRPWILKSILTLKRVHVKEREWTKTFTHSLLTMSGQANNLGYPDKPRQSVCKRILTKTHSQSPFDNWETTEKTTDIELKHTIRRSPCSFVSRWCGCTFNNSNSLYRWSVNIESSKIVTCSSRSKLVNYRSFWYTQCKFKGQVDNETSTTASAETIRRNILHTCLLHDIR